MPIVFCSQKLSKLINLSERLSSPSLDNWNGHLFALQGRKCLVFVHKDTFYSFVLFDVLKADLKDFQSVFLAGFLEQLEHDRLLAPGYTEKITHDFEKVDLSTTDGDRSTIGYINDCIARLTWQTHDASRSMEKVKDYVSTHYNKNPLVSRKAYPRELMKEKLTKYA